jgi:hypothetical protein
MSFVTLHILVFPKEKQFVYSIYISEIYKKDYDYLSNISTIRSSVTNTGLYPSSFILNNCLQINRTE